jgi:predicted Rossmann fold flavoprotein
MSGPAILKLSSLGARELARADYGFEVAVNWMPDSSPDVLFKRLNAEKLNSGRRLIIANGPAELPRRLWERLVLAAGIHADAKWANLQRKQILNLVAQLSESRFQIRGKSMNKEEFVTCGGVALNEVDFRRMESRVTPGLFFAGEVLDIDGVTGGFNFQAAWTTGMIAGEAAGAEAGS